MPLARIITAALVSIVLGTTAIAESIDVLRSEVKRIASVIDGDVGASIAFAGEEPISLINGEGSFPMMSTVKTLVSMQALGKVATGELALDTQVTVTEDDLSVMSPLNLTFPVGPTTTSLYNLIWTAIVDSDNTAPNTMMRIMDGPEGVKEFVEKQGVSGINVNRNINGLFIDAYQVPDFDAVEALMDQKAKEPGGIMGFFVAPIESPLLTDPRDTTTPDGMAKLLSRFLSGEVLPPQETKVLKSIMEQTRTGAGRIKGMLPPGTVVGHKTGTGHNVINDAGYIRLPDGRDLVIAIYTNNPGSIAAKEMVIAQIARAAYDWALYSTN